MAFNELEAMKMIDDGKLSDEEISLLTRLRGGILATDLTTAEDAKSDTVEQDEKAYAELEKKGLVAKTGLSAPNVSVHADVAIPTEAGLTVLNLFDKRFRENAFVQQPDAQTAPDVDTEIVKAPTDDQARKVPSLEAKPLAAEDKNLGYIPAANEEAMKDPLVAAGARDPANAELSAETVLTEDAKVTIPKDASVGVDGSAFDRDNNGKVGGSLKKSPKKD